MPAKDYSVTPPEHGDVQTGTDGAGVTLWRAIYYPPRWFLTWTVGFGYLAPPIRCDRPGAGFFKWRDWI